MPKFLRNVSIMTRHAARDRLAHRLPYVTFELASKTRTRFESSKKHTESRAPVLAAGVTSNEPRIRLSLRHGRRQEQEKLPIVPLATENLFAITETYFASCRGFYRKFSICDVTLITYRYDSGNRPNFLLLRQ